jgi:PUCC protein.
MGLAWGGLHPSNWQLSLNVFVLGFANGAFAVAAIASMMMLASQGHSGKEGLRMGLWGAAQAIAFALGGFTGTVAADLARQWLTEPALAYGAVFLFEAALFIVSAQLGAGIRVPATTGSDASNQPRFGDIAMHEMMDGGVS